MTAALLFASTALAGIVEALLLHRIVFHQAGGWDSPGTTFLTLLFWASAPLLAALIVIAIAQGSPMSLRRIIRPIAVAGVAGPLFGYIALAQYSHSTPGFMMLGFAVQVVAVLLAAIKLALPPRSTPQADAPADSVADQTPSARAGERGSGAGRVAEADEGAGRPAA